MLLNLSDPSVTLATGGGKAASLAGMLRAGLPVPDGVVVPTAAYRAFVEHNGLGAVLDRAWEEVRGAPGEVERIAESVRAAFTSGNLPDGVEDALVTATRGMGAVAVRSSATAEDLPEASFAGQQDTYLNVIGPAAVVDAVRRCWASLWTGRALAYRARQGIGPRDVALAVVIQRMAPATAAGVLFTAHPISGHRDRRLINATFGLGEALVSGRVEPDTIVTDGSGAVLKRARGAKGVRTEALAGGGTAEVAESRTDAEVLSDAQVAALVGLGNKLEAIFGAPQDVEWAIVDGAPVLLQSRPITTLVPGDDAWPPLDRAERQPFDFWTQQDMGERWPEPPTPLTWSISEPMNQEVLDRTSPRWPTPSSCAKCTRCGAPGSTRTSHSTPTPRPSRCRATTSSNSSCVRTAGTRGSRRSWSGGSPE